MIYFAFMSEKYYVRKIICLQKECWKRNMNKQESIECIIEYLNTKRFCTKRHSFILKFREKLQEAYLEEENYEKISKVYRELHIYNKKNYPFN